MSEACKLVIAGPGTGKTHGMVEEVASKLPSILPNRFIVVITYTNAATEVIRERLQKRLQLPPNLFIGTTHSFLNRFFLLPYARLFGYLPAKTVFIDSVNLPYVPKNRFIEKYGKIKHSNTLLKQGVVCHDKTIEISHKLMQNEEVANFVANRLQMVFIDEYQDATILQHEIFKTLIGNGKTPFYFVGDPEQSIFSFRYSKSLIMGEKAPGFKEIPIMDFKEELGEDHVVNKNINKRSDESIVSFLNNFNTQERQTTIEKDSSKSNNCIKFINKNEIEEIIKCFNKLCKDDYGSKLFLSYQRNTLETLAAKFNLLPKSNDSNSQKNKLLSECLRYIAAVVGNSQKEIRQDKDWNQIEWRKKGVKVLKALIDNPFISQEEVNSFIERELLLVVNPEINCKNVFEKLRGSFAAIEFANEDCISYYSTIHKSKGLEADAVLVIAESLSRLNKWIERDKAKRFDDKSDQCRLGFVAFSRAKKLLCIACLEDARSIRKTLQSMNIDII